MSLTGPVISLVVAEKRRRRRRRGRGRQVTVSLFVVLVGSVLVNYFALLIVRPLQRLAASMERVAVLDFSDPADRGGGGGGVRGAGPALREVAAIDKSFGAMARNLRWEQPKMRTRWAGPLKVPCARAACVHMRVCVCFEACAVLSPRHTADCGPSPLPPFPPSLHFPPPPPPPSLSLSLRGEGGREGRGGGREGGEGGEEEGGRKGAERGRGVGKENGEDITRAHTLARARVFTVSTLPRARAGAHSPRALFPAPAFPHRTMPPHLDAHPADAPNIPRPRPESPATSRCFLARGLTQLLRPLPPGARRQPSH